MDYKIALFSKLTRFAYRFNVRKNRYLVVQQQWMREALGNLLKFPQDRIIVSSPSFSFPQIPVVERTGETVFFYPSTADCHKNFETFCAASALLENKIGNGRFRSVITLTGNENKYASWLYNRFKDISSIEFRGFLPKEKLLNMYGSADCLVFPSRSETWGLPISEFKSTGKPMILADLPYSHETSKGSDKVAFFSPSDISALAQRMEEVIDGNLSSFADVPVEAYKEPVANSWNALFELLLN